MDLKCITASFGGFCYRSHLPRLGPSQQTAEKDERTCEYGWKSIGSVSGITDDAVIQSSEEPSTADSSSSGFVDSDYQKVRPTYIHKTIQTAFKGLLRADPDCFRPFAKFSIVSFRTNFREGGRGLSSIYYTKKLRNKVNIEITFEKNLKVMC